VRVEGGRPELPTVFFDVVRIAVRSDVPMVILSLLHRIPGVSKDTDAVEVFRGITTFEHATKIANALSIAVNQQPAPNKEAEK